MKFDRLFTGTFRGQPAFSDGKFICVGKAPEATVTIAFTNDQMNRAVRGMIPKKPRKATRAFGIVDEIFVQWIPFTPGRCHVDLRYVKFIEKLHPEAGWYMGNAWGPNGERPLLRIKDNKVVGLIQPRRS